MILERDREAGGILQQCIHNGFGLHHFHEELTGPGYAQRCYDLVKDKEEIEILVDTMVLNISQDKVVTAVNPTQGLIRVQGKTVILTMGCRERTRGAIRIPGYRPAGVFTAGAAQRMVNMEGYLPGKKSSSSAVVISDSSWHAVCPWKAAKSKLSWKSAPSRMV